MSKYFPDGWNIIKLPNEDYRVFAGFRGGYLTSDSWRINSGCVSTEVTSTGWLVYGDSGSCYDVNKHSYDRHGAYNSNILEALCIKNNGSVLSEDEAFEFLNSLVKE